MPTILVTALTLMPPPSEFSKYPVFRIHDSLFVVPEQFGLLFQTYMSRCNQVQHTVVWVLQRKNVNFMLEGNLI